MTFRSVYNVTWCVTGWRIVMTVKMRGTVRNRNRREERGRRREGKEGRRGRGGGALVSADFDLQIKY